MSRQLTVALEAVEGAITRFYAFIDAKRIIAADGTENPEWTGSVSDQITLKIRVTGIDSAKYKLTIDLPENLHDQTLTFQLQDGYHEVEITI
jgi:hypothetical protein